MSDRPLPARFKGVRLPSLMVLLGVALGLYYFFVFRPLSRRAAELDRPLVSVWDRFAATNESSPSTAGLNLENFERRLYRLQTSATNLSVAERLVDSRIALAPEVFARMNQAFQLIDFQDETHQRVEQLTKLAKETGVALENGATNGWPDYVADMPQPSLLWARLHVTHQLLLTAIRCKVSAIRAISQLPTLSHRSTTDGATFLQELPMRLELTGPMENVTRFLVSLPLKSADLKAVGLAEVLTNKPALFIDQVLLRKHSPQQPHEVLLELTLCDFVPWTETPEKPTVKGP